MEKVILIFSLILSSHIALSAPKVGKAAAARYFQRNGNSDYVGRVPSQAAANAPKEEEAPPVVRKPKAQVQPKERKISNVSSNSQTDHYMMIGAGTFASSDSYNWGHGLSDPKKSGKWGADVTYRISQDEYLFDQALKLSFNQYEVDKTTVNKLGVLYSLTFPESETRFPLYFGVAAGPGFFLKQIEKESVLTLDYQLFFGIRVFNIFENTGLFVEGGLKNHINILTDGQFNGSFLSVGAVFLF